MSEEETNSKKELFWADKIVKKITERQNFRWKDKKIPDFKEYVVKTSASISGVLHIGRLSDTTRGAAVKRALSDHGLKSRIIWVAEDMDPLRKIPEGVPKTYEKYIGAPVSNIPDPEGCHDSYSNHHKEEYFKVLDKFAFEDMEKYSMKDEYEKGNFREFVKKIIENVSTVVEIQNKHRTNPLKKGWKPWTPICQNCDKIITPKIKLTGDMKISYVCQDYEFETKTAKGCGYKGEADPLKDPGKLVWKSEWAAQWARWNVVTEGAGKEYQVPNSAFWINAEISEKALDYPMPEPIFYEHIMVDGVKMSASLGNVIYPRDWLQVSTPQVLRYYFNKRLMMTRSFSWKELPNLYDEYDAAAKIFWDKEKLENEKEQIHLKRMFEISNRTEDIDRPLEMNFSHAAMLAQAFKDQEKMVDSLKRINKYDENLKEEVLKRVDKAARWVELYAPEELKFQLNETVPEGTKESLSDSQKTALRQLAEVLKSADLDEEKLSNEIYEIIKNSGIKPKDFFQAAYLTLLGKEKGPRLASFVLSLKDRAAKVFEQV